MINLMKKDWKALGLKKLLLFIVSGVLLLLLASTSWHAPKNPITKAYITLGIVDHDNSEYSNMLLSYFEENKLFSKYATIIKEDEPSIKKRFERNELTAYFIIPKGFAQNLIDIVNIPMKVVINTQDKTKAIVLNNMLRAYEKYIKQVEINCVNLYDIMEQEGRPYEEIDRVNEEISYQLVFTVLGKSNFFTSSPQEDLEVKSFASYYGTIVLFLFLTYFSMYAGLDVLKELQQGTLRRIMTTSVHPSVFFLHKILFYESIFAIVLSVSQCVLALSNMVIPAWKFIFLLVVYLLQSAIFLTFSVMFVKIPNYLLACNIVIIFEAVLGGGMIPIIYLPDLMHRLAVFMPVYQFVKIISHENGAVSAFPRMILLCLMVSIGLVMFVSLSYRRWKGGNQNAL